MRVVFCSCPRDVAGDLARKVVEARLVACAQVLPKIESYYWWEGELCQDKEALLLLKTDVSVMPKLTDFLKEHHPYSVPEIIATPIDEGEGNPDYLLWLQNEIQQS